jgi:hypothetical protein
MEKLNKQKSIHAVADDVTVQRSQDTNDCGGIIRDVLLHEKYIGIAINWLKKYNL